MSLKPLVTTQRKRYLILVLIIIIMILHYLAWSSGLPSVYNIAGTGNEEPLLQPLHSNIHKTIINKRRPESRSSRDDELKFREYLESALKYDKGMGCKVPTLDPFLAEATRFEKSIPPLRCQYIMGFDWVRCHLSKCAIRKEIQDSYKNIECFYRDIIYITDLKYNFGGPVKVSDNNTYVLERCDHVQVSCSGYSKDEPGKSSSWEGLVLGYRKMMPKLVPSSRADTVNVLIFAFDTTSRNIFVRQLPKSFKMLNETMGAFVSDSFNVLGEGTLSTMFPMLTGHTELELPDIWRSSSNLTVDIWPWIWYKLREDGYTTAYFEDITSPDAGTFQYYFYGFAKQPTDHYIRPFLMEKTLNKPRLPKNAKYCVGDTPTFKVFMNSTKDFHTLPGKKFSLSFVADITHEDMNLIKWADNDFLEFLNHYWTSGLNNNTLLIVMGDHGPRFNKVRRTLNGRLEERLPFLSIVLPKTLKKRRPKIEENLKNNYNVLTTPHDLYATIMDALDLRQYWNPYKIKGAHLTRGVSLFEPIPRNRSCSEAGIQPFYCTCLKWDKLPQTDPLIKKAANGLVGFINQLLKEVRSKCIPRNLKSIDYMSKLQRNVFASRYKVEYQIRLTMGPGNGIYEATAELNTATDKFIFRNQDISRITAYGSEPRCITATHPHLNKYCYCKNKTLHNERRKRTISV